MQITERTLWKYDAGDEGVLTGTFIATLGEIQDVCGEMVDHSEFGQFIVDEDDFRIVASDLNGEEDTAFIDAVVSREAESGFNPIAWATGRRLIADDDYIDDVLDEQHIGEDDEGGDFADTEIEEDDVE